MEKEANQLYRRPQMTGQARDEDEEDCVHSPPNVSKKPGMKDEEEGNRHIGAMYQLVGGTHFSKELVARTLHVHVSRTYEHCGCIL